MCTNGKRSRKCGKREHDSDESEEVDARPDEHGVAEREENERGDCKGEYGLGKEPCEDVVVSL